MTTNLQPSQQEAAAELLRRRKARSGLLDFIQYTMPEYKADAFHRTLASYLDRMATGEIKKLMVFAPPQHGKSQLVSRHFPAYMFGRNPDCRIIGATYAATLAESFNRDVQRLVDSDRYRKLFPDTKLADENNRTLAGGPLRNSSVFEIVGHKGSYRAAGRGQGITGLPANLAIIDDPLKDDEEAYSATIRQSCWEWYTGSLITRMDEDGAILLTNTRWHRDDLAGRALALESNGWTVLRFPAIAEQEREGYDQRAPGEPLAPQLKSLAFLESMRVTQGPVKWAAMYQQNPRPEGGSEFPPEWFENGVWFDEDQWPQGWTCRAIALDPSKGKESKAGDYSAFVKCVLGQDGKLYVGAEIGRWNVDLLAEMLVDMAERFHPDAVGCETLQFQQLIASNFDERCKRKGLAIRSTPLEDVTKKVIRIRRLTPFLSRKDIRFLKSPGTKMLVEQLRDFPYGDYDDGPDALEMAVRLVQSLLQGNAEADATEEFVRT